MAGMNSAPAKLSKIHDECEPCLGCGYVYMISEDGEHTPMQCVECNGYGVRQKVDANGCGIPKEPGFMSEWAVVE